jgi:hypothetical protein
MTQTIIEWIKASGTIIAAVSLYLAYRQLRASVRWNRIDATYAFLPETVYLERERAAANALLGIEIDLYKQEKPLTPEIVTSILNDSNVFKEAKDFLNLFEDYATAYKAEAVDHDHAYLLSASRFIRYFQVFQPFIRELRARRENPMIWREFELLVTKDWSVRQKQEIEKVADEHDKLRHTKGYP